MSSKIIVANRGDTVKFKVAIHNVAYELQKNETLYFGLMDPHQSFEDALVKKKITMQDTQPDGSIIIELKPEDTLDLYPGTYYYALKVHTYSQTENIDEVKTIINKTKFIIND